MAEPRPFFPSVRSTSTFCVFVATGPVTTSHIPVPTGPAPPSVFRRTSLTKFAWVSVARKRTFFVFACRNRSSLLRSAS